MKTGIWNRLRDRKWFFAGILSTVVAGGIGVWLIERALVAGAYLIAAAFGLDVIIVVLDVRRWLNNRQDEIRGFEVKLSMGQTPMLLKKEDDHG